MTKDENVKTIRFPVRTDQKLQAIANKCGLTKLEFFRHMVDYFYKSKKDPRDLNDELLKNALSRKTDNIVAFIRTQEQELLIPLKTESEELLNGQQQVIDLFNRHILTHNHAQDRTNKEQAAATARILQLVERADAAQQDKRQLKSRVLAILEYYISAREQMGMMTKQADKDALVQHVRQQIINL